MDMGHNPDPTEYCDRCELEIPKKRIVQGTKTKDGGWIGYDTKYNPYGKVVIKDKRGRVISLEG